MPTTLTQFRHIPSNSFFRAAAFFVFGIAISLTWYEPGLFFAIGDNYPKVNASATFLKSFYLWSDEHFGYFNPASPVINHWAIWALLDSGLGVGLGETIFYGIMMGGSMYFVYLLAFRLFGSVLGAITSSLLYVFNFFYVNHGYTITIAYGMFFMPLIIVAYLRIIDKIKLNADHVRETLLLVIILAISIPILYVNPGVLYTVSLTSLIFPAAYIINHAEIRKKIIKNVIVIGLLVVPALSWFIFANYLYLNRPNSSFDFVTSDWSWTHERLSAPNLLRLDGAWSWGEYWSKSYVEFYNNPYLISASYLPVAFAVMAIILAMLYKRDRLKHVLLCILPITLMLVFLRDSTGLFGQFVYDILPYSFVFREPYTKLLIPLTMFVSLLAGFSVHVIFRKLSNHKLLESPGKAVPNSILISRKIISRVTVVSIVVLLLSNGLPLVGSLHLRSLIIPGNEDRFSSYVNTPDYWKDAAEWINQQQGDWKVLFLPNDDFYQMPYEWGYYGVDYLSLYISKPVVMEYYEYLLPSSTINSIGSIYDSITLDDPVDFQRKLRLHDVKYIIQRNDVVHDLPGRAIIDPQTINTFLSSQKEIVKVQTYGKLDIYEFVDGPNSSLGGTEKFDKITLYEFDDEFEGWNVNLPDSIKTGTDSKNVLSDEKSLRVELVERPNVWATINLPVTEAGFFSIYTWQLGIRGEDTYEVHIKVAEFNKEGEIIDTKYLAFVGNGTFDWKRMSISYVVSNPDIVEIQLQIWFGFDTPAQLPNTIWLDDVKLFETRYNRVNPSTYHTQLLSDVPVTLVIAQTYDPLWQARVDDTIVKSEPVSEILNGFSIPSAKSSEVMVEYGSQQSFDALVVASFSLIAVYLLLFKYPSLLTYKFKILKLAKRIPH